MKDLTPALDQAVREGKLLASSASNIQQLLARASSPVYAESIRELVEAGQWKELDDRFFRTLAFGTGGLRGRTIGKVVTKAEQGTPNAMGRPQFPCVGTNSMNFYNISRATQGLVAYLKEWFAKESLPGRPKIVIACDTRHFSQEFAELAAKVAIELGCDACLFSGPRSTPQLSFAVRHTGASAGIVLTASHNPPHDNGFKCYFADGGQVVEPHASGIIAKVNAVESEAYSAVAPESQGALTVFGTEVDEAYMNRLETLILDPELVKSQTSLKIVYTSIHGTGGQIIKPMLKRLGFQALTVPEQDVMDGRFPTVKSPNPENAEALSMGMELASRENADLVIATDPDCDRMGVAARNSKGELQLFTGNQIGSLLAYYRVRKLIEQGVITQENKARAALIKTYVTTDLQKAIASHFGLHCVETLTGFKYIGQKLGKFQKALPANFQANYTELSEAEKRAILLEHSHYYVCGGEESYGYSASDFVRDKDGNGATVMFAEVAAYAKSKGLSLDQLLDEIYNQFGFYLEKNGNLVFEGAEGAAKIQQLIATYAANPPKEIEGVAVTSARDFATETIFDSEGDQIPSEKMMMFSLANGGRVAVRPSGTEPKIKYYLFAVQQPGAGQSLEAVKAEVSNWLEQLWTWLQSDANERLSA
jgi:phosphoglucomutase